MDRFVIKRDGRRVKFDRDRIASAIFKAARAVGGRDRKKAEFLAGMVEWAVNEKFYNKGLTPTVEDIQDVVEKILIEQGHAKVAKAYILYRQKRAEARELESILLDGVKLVDEYIERSDWRVAENSNMTYSLQGLNFYLASSVVARYWLNKIYPKEIREAHDSGDFHIHDLGILGVYCVGWDLEDLLRVGFGGVRGKIESKPAKHFRVALGQIVNFFYTLQGEAAGAQAFSNFDTLLAPFIRYDNLSYRDVKQAIQEFLFNINVPTRVGFQTPFTNITLDLTVSPLYKGKHVIIGGKEMPETYDEFQEEMDMLNRAFAEVMMEGDARSRIFTFPIPTYNITKDFDWDNDVLKPLWEMTAKFGVPYFANFVHSDMKPEDARSMCCRLRLDNRELRKRGGGLFGAAPLTGSIGVVTINLPRIGYLAQNEDELFQMLEDRMYLAHKSLEIKRKVLEDLTERGLYPYSKFYLRSIKQAVGSYWNNHFSTIGLVGMNEMCRNFLGVPITHPEARELALKVLKFMRERIADFQADTGNLYNLEATPAEGASYRLARKDVERYPGIKTAGTVTSPYYTNSVHVPVNYTNDIFEVLEHQDELQIQFTGGTVVHLFLGESVKDWRIVRALVRKIVNNYRLPYFSLTPTFSICPIHGYIPGEHWVCPYPHSEEDLKRFGVIREVDEDELSRLPEGSYILLDEEEEKEEAPFGGLILKLDNL